MFPEIKIDRNSKLSAYRQIMQAIIDAIKEGKLEAGEKLLTERDLSEKIEVSRGTVKKAYIELKRNNIINIYHGKGCFISNKHPLVTGNRNTRALMLIDNLLTKLKSLKFSHREIQNLVNLKIAEHEEKLQNVNIAAVDCNPESLRIYYKQIGLLSRLPIKRFLLDDIKNSSSPQTMLKDFELIITTSTHYNEIVNILKGLYEKIFQIIVSPADRTIAGIAQIGNDKQLGIVCESERFFKVISKKLTEYNIPERNIFYHNVYNIEGFDSFILSKDILITVPDYELPVSMDNISCIQTFTQHGGRIIEFDYKIEKGSLMYLEEKILSILELKEI